jgi:hypothetical protein
MPPQFSHLLVSQILRDFSAWRDACTSNRAEVVRLFYRCVTSGVGRALVGLRGQMVWLRLRLGIYMVRIRLWLCGTVRLLLLVCILLLTSLFLWGIIADPARGGRGV